MQWNRNIFSVHTGNEYCAAFNFSKLVRVCHNASGPACWAGY